MHGVLRVSLHTSIKSLVLGSTSNAPRTFGFLEGKGVGEGIRTLDFPECPEHFPMLWPLSYPHLTSLIEVSADGYRF